MQWTKEALDMLEQDQPYSDSYMEKTSRRGRHPDIGTQTYMGPWLDLDIINIGRKRTCMGNDAYDRNVRDIGDNNIHAVATGGSDLV